MTDHVVWAGTLAAMVIAAVTTLVLTRHPSAPFAAAAGGLGLAAGVAATHLAGDWGVLSDSLRLGPLSWLAVCAELGGLALVGLVGLRDLRRDAHGTSRGARRLSGAQIPQEGARER